MMRILDLLFGAPEPKRGFPLTGLLIGAGVGVAIGLLSGILLAPESGIKTRGRLAAGTRDTAAHFRESVLKQRKRLRKLLESRREAARIRREA